MHSSSDKSYIAQDWNERRLYVLNRDGYKCRNCGGKSGLQVHHIIPRSQSVNHHVDNLITLCVYCHSKHHNADFVPAAIERKLRLSQYHKTTYKMRKSRKEHHCSDCNRLIEKGTSYYFAQRGYIQKKLCEQCFLKSSSGINRF
ncbi:MAG: HNH endonuclease [Thermodesulfobacteriota bacterium]